MTDSPKCTFCGNDNMAEIKYGYPTPVMIERARQELIALGGIKDVGYTHYCYSCNETFPPTEW
jgi:hypothetical protein